MAQKLSFSRFLKLDCSNTVMLEHVYRLRNTRSHRKSNISCFCFLQYSVHPPSSSLWPSRSSDNIGMWPIRCDSDVKHPPQVALKFMKETLGYFPDPREGLRLDNQLITNERLKSKMSQSQSIIPFFSPFTNISCLRHKSSWRVTSMSADTSSSMLCGNTLLETSSCD